MKATKYFWLYTVGCDGFTCFFTPVFSQTKHCHPVLFATCMVHDVTGFVVYQIINPCSLEVFRAFNPFSYFRQALYQRVHTRDLSLISVVD